MVCFLTQVVQDSMLGSHHLTARFCTSPFLSSSSLRIILTTFRSLSSSSLIESFCSSDIRSLVAINLEDTVRHIAAWVKHMKTHKTHTHHSKSHIRACTYTQTTKWKHLEVRWNEASSRFCRPSNATNMMSELEMIICSPTVQRFSLTQLHSIQSNLSQPWPL